MARFDSFNRELATGFKIAQLQFIQIIFAALLLPGADGWVAQLSCFSVARDG